MNMKRNRPYSGQPHTDSGMRGSQLVKGLTYRDIMDCYIRGFFLCCFREDPIKYGEAQKGENANLNENSVYDINLKNIDPMAVWKNMSCEMEKMMGIYPNTKINHLIEPIMEDKKR